MSPTDFVAYLRRLFPNLEKVHCGGNWRFGLNGAGTAQTLRDAGISVKVSRYAKVADCVISSTRIRAALAEGDVEAAAAMLGRPYSVSGGVTHGKSVGHAFGFPTANVAAATLLPAYGVYETRIAIDGREYRALSDVGVRPTLEDAGEERIESFLLDFAGDLYGKHLRISFLRRLREERRFDSAEALWAQIKKDVDSINNERS
jgi:riboflavin kinase/FMN adenylyltransferase